MSGANRTRRGRGHPRAKRRHGIFFSFFWTFLCLGFLGGGAYAVFDYIKSSDDFTVLYVDVRGNEALTKETIALQSGVTTDDSVFALDLKIAAARVEAMPYVKSCKASVVFPDTVLLVVEERQPQMSLIVNNRTYSIDWEGVPVEEQGQSVSPLEPYITNAEGVDFVELGEPLRSPALHTALTVWEEFIGVRADRFLTVSELAAYSETDIRMYCDEFDYEIRWARGDIADQALRLAGFLDAKSRGAVCREYIDLRFGQNIVCK